MVPLSEIVILSFPIIKCHVTIKHRKDSMTLLLYAEFQTGDRYQLVSFVCNLSNSC